MQTLGKFLPAFDLGKVLVILGKFNKDILANFLYNWASIGKDFGQIRTHLLIQTGLGNFALVQIKINTAYCDKFLRNKPRNLIWNN